MTQLPEGYVDPTDPDAVGQVLAATVASGGLAAVADLLSRLPGARTTAEVPHRLLKAGVPGAVWLGAEWCWSLTEPPTLLQVVGGVVLHRTPVETGQVAAVLARPVADLVRRTSEVAEASVVLTVARDLAAES